MKTQTDAGELPVQLLAVDRETRQSSHRTQSKELHPETDYSAWMNEADDHQRKLWLCRERKRRYLRNETEEQRQHRRMMDRERKRRSRLHQAEEMQQYRLAIQCTLSQNETDEACQQVLVRGRAVDEQRQQRLQSGRERKRRMLQNETEEHRQQRLSLEREKKRQTRLFESEEARQYRLTNDRTRKREQLRNETAEHRQKRLATDRERKRRSHMSKSQEQHILEDSEESEAGDSGLVSSDTEENIQQSEHKGTYSRVYTAIG